MGVDGTTVEVCTEPLIAILNRTQFAREPGITPEGALLASEVRRTLLEQIYNTTPALCGTIENSSAEGKDLPLPELPPGTYASYEIQRCPHQEPLGVIAYPSLDQILAVTDQNGEPCGFVSMETGEKPVFSRDALPLLAQMGVVVDDAWNETEAIDFIRQMGEETSLTRKLLDGFSTDSPYCAVPFENAFRVFDLYQRATLNQKEAILEIVAMRSFELTTMLSYLSDPAFAQLFPRIYEAHLPEFSELFEATNGVLGNIEELWFATHKDPRIREIRSYLTSRARAVFAAAVSLADDPEFSWELPFDSLSAVQEIVYEFCGLDPQNVTGALEVLEFGKLQELLVSHAGDSAWRDVLKGYLDARWYWKMREEEPGTIAAQSSPFYRAVGQELYIHRDESTGDKALQVTLAVNAIEQLRAGGVLPKDFSMLDAGCGPMSFLISLREALDEKDRPGSIDAMDKDAYPVPAELYGRVTFIRADLSKREITEEHLIAYDIIIIEWSPLSDNDAILQKEFLDTVNRMLKSGGVAIIESPVGYEKEMMEQMQTRGSKTKGKIYKEFPTSRGPVGKDFEITPAMGMIDRTVDSGFRALNMGAAAPITVPSLYVTSAGAERGFLVLQKIREPMVSLDQVANPLFWGAGSAPSQDEIRL